MFTKQNQPQDPQQPPQPVSTAQGDVIFNVSAADFEDKVIRASMETPVIVDFWAPWCEPCKQLGPILEAAVKAAGGQVLMAKVNMDENKELAGALRIQSIPAVFAFFQGKPVGNFTGVKPESEIKAFVEKFVMEARGAQPGALDVPAALKAAAQALAEQDFGTAHQVYAQILSGDQKNVPAYVGLVRTFIGAGQLEQAAELVENAPEEISKASQFTEAKTALELAQATPSGSLEELGTKVNEKPDDHQARFDLALAEFSAGQKEAAIDSLLEILSRDREWNEDAARKQILKFLEAMGFADPLAIAGRKKLSTLLFS